MCHWIEVAVNVCDVPVRFYGPYASFVEAEQALKKKGWEDYQLRFPVVAVWVFIYTARIMELKRTPQKNMRKPKEALPYQ